MIGTQDKRAIDFNGFVEVFDNPISAVGIYQYINPPGAPEQGKIYNVLRPEEELTRKETLDSLKLMPIVDDHPSEPGMLGDNPNAIEPERKGIHGVVGEKVYFKDGMIYGNLKIHSSNLLDKIDNQGKKELSAGYWAEYEYTPGMWNGQTYDAIQRNITFNHVALVDRGRMGSSVSVQDTIQEFTTTATDEADMHDPAKLAELKEAIAALAALFQNFLSEEASEGAAVTDSDDENKEKTEDMCDEDKEKTEDADEEEKEKTEDMSDEDKTDEDEKEGTKDSDDLSAIIDKAVKDALAKVAQRDTLYTSLKPHIGVMDASDMTLEQLAKYAVKKIGIGSVDGQEVAAVNGYLAGLKTQGTQDAGFTQQHDSHKLNFKDFE